MATRPKRPRDTNQLAKLIVDISTGEVNDKNPDEGKDPIAIELGRRGGLKSAQVRSATLTPERRKEIGQTLVYARRKKAKSRDKA